MAVAAKLAWARRLGVGSAFGATSRLCKRAKQKMTRQAFWARGQQLQPFQKAQEVNRTLSSDKLGEAISAARTMQLMTGAAQKKDLDTKLSLLRGFAAHEGKELLSFFRNSIPALPLEFDEMMVVPSCLGHAIFLPALASMSTTAATAFAGQAKASNVSQQLEQQWLQWHEPIGIGKLHADKKLLLRVLVEMPVAVYALHLERSSCNSRMPSSRT